MESTWFVVADRSQAQLYEVVGPKLKPELRELETMTHPEVRLSGEPSASSSQHQMLGDHSGADAEEDRRFVRRVVERLLQAQHQREFDKLVIAAPADFVGRIRELASRRLSKSVHREIIADYTHDNRRSLQDRMRRKAWLT